jgi:hypothetical protein
MIQCRSYCTSLMGPLKGAIALFTVLSAALASAQTVTITPWTVAVNGTAGLPDPSSGTTYCAQPVFGVVSGHTTYTGMHFRYNINCSGAPTGSKVGVSYRFYTECYDSTMTYLGFVYDQAGDVDGVLGSAQTALWAEDFTYSGQASPGSSQKDGTPVGTYYLIYGVKIHAWIQNSSGTMILASTTYNGSPPDWNNWESSTINSWWKIDWGTNPGYLEPVSGWFQLNNQWPALTGSSTTPQWGGN